MSFGSPLFLCFFDPWVVVFGSGSGLLFFSFHLLFGSLCIFCVYLVCLFFVLLIYLLIYLSKIKNKKIICLYKFL